MHWVHATLVFGSMIITIALLVRYLFWSVDSEYKEFARLEQDNTYRAEALAQLDNALQQTPNNTRLRRRRADLRRHDKNWHGVIEDLSTILTSGCSDDTLWYEYAEASYEANEMPKTLNALQEAIRIDPTYLDYHALRTRAALRAGKEPLARTAVDRWLELAAELSSAPPSKHTPNIPGWRHRILPVREPDLYLCRAAVAQTEGNNDEANQILKEALTGTAGHDLTRNDFQQDPVYAPLLSLPEAECLSCEPQGT